MVIGIVLVSQREVMSGQSLPILPRFRYLVTLKIPRIFKWFNSIRNLTKNRDGLNFPNAKVTLVRSH